MTDVQDMYLRMFVSVIRTMDDHSAAWSGNANCTALKGEIEAAVAGMRQSLQGQDRKPSAINKQQARAALEAATLQIAEALTAMATIAADTDLLRASKLTARIINRAAEDALLGIVKRITDLATTHAAALTPYGISPALVSDCVAKSTAFSALTGDPAAQVQERRLQTIALENYRKGGVEACRNLDPQVRVIGHTAAQFAYSYFEARKLRKVGHRKRALQVRVTSADGKPVVNAMITIPGVKVKRKTTEKGQAYIQHLPEGEHKLRVEAEGFLMKEVPVFISKQERELKEIVLGAR
jgi:hypothetical protein